MVDLSFWLTFTKLKLDVWKLGAPQVEIKGHISLPGNPNMPQDIIVSEQSFAGYEKSQLGGLISSEISGILVHTNTIEEYEAFNIEDLVQREWGKTCEMHANGIVPTHLNRFIILVFGDLKNYKFSMRSILLEQATDHIQQRKANRLSTFINA